MDRHNVVLAYLSDYYTTGSLEAWSKEAPGRFLLSAIPFSPDGIFRSPIDTTALRTDYTSRRFKGMGEITAQYFGLAPNDPRLEPYFALADELSIPVSIHTAGIGAPDRRFRASLGNPLLLEEVIAGHPKLRLFIAHAGYPFLEETIAVMTYYPQVYADLSAIDWFVPRATFHQYLKGLIDAGLEKRLMFGSDSQEWPETVDMSIAAIQSTPFLNGQQKRDLFYNNAARFLRLDDAQSSR